MSDDLQDVPTSELGGSLRNNTAVFAIPLPANDVADRIRAVVEPDSGIARLGGRTSQLPFVGTVGEYSFAFRRPGRNSFRPLFLGRIREAGGASALEIEARNMFDARNPVLLFMTGVAIALVGGSALTSGPGFALTIVVLAAVLLGASYALIGRWQRSEVGRICDLIERVGRAATVDDARSIALIAQ